MNEIFNRGMAAATLLTRAGKIKEATALIQKVLRGETPDAGHADRLIEAPHIDATANEASHTNLRRIFTQTAASAEAMLARGRKTRTDEQPVSDAPTPGTFAAGSFSNAAGSRTYKLYTPAKHDGGLRPLIVMLHGCSQAPDDFAAGTRMNVCAEEHGCFVLYPEQSSSANAGKCWNWFKSSDQLRDQGEPSILAELTRELIKTKPIDANRVFITGLSAGGAAAAVMGEAYPDIFAAVGVHSGLACGAARDMQSAFAAMSGQPSRGPAAARQSATFVPTIVFHGDRDTTVHPRNAADVIARAGELASLQLMTETLSAAGRSCTRAVHRDGSGRPVMEEWTIHGAGHAWSGGSTRGSYTDAKGPDASREMLRFFLAQSK